jgi:hypothetical protein
MSQFVVTHFGWPMLYMHEGSGSNTMRRRLALLVAVGLIVAACGSAATTTTTTTSSIAEARTTSEASSDAAAGTVPPIPGEICSEPLPGEVYVEDASIVANPALGNQDLPVGYQPFDDRDAPESAYAPCYVKAADAVFNDDTIVIGIEIDGSAKAYSRSQLIAHLVNDHFGTTPILVAY